MNQHKFHKARSALEHNLFQLSPVFQAPLRRFHGLCYELSHVRMHNVQPETVSSPTPAQPMVPMAQQWSAW